MTGKYLAPGQARPHSANRAFSLSWPAHMQIYWNKRKYLHKTRVDLPQDWFGTPTWPPLQSLDNKPLIRRLDV